MKPYRVQVIIPVYNSEKTIARCLESLKSQTFSQWQALIADDVSTDGSAEIIKGFAENDDRFVYIRCDRNGGPARARNKALELLDGEYAAFLDSDDIWEKDMLKKLFALADGCGADVVQCGFSYELPGGKMLYPKGAFGNDVVLRGSGLRKIYLRMMTGINMNHVCMKLIRSDIIRGMRFDTELKTAEDIDFCIRMFRNANTYCYTADRLYRYYRGEGSLTSGGLSFGERLAANKRVSRTLAAALPSVGMNGLFFRLLAYARPYIIICSKAVRIIREKYGAAAGEGVKSK